MTKGSKGPGGRSIYLHHGAALGLLSVSPVFTRNRLVFSFLRLSLSLKLTDSKLEIIKVKDTNTLHLQKSITGIIQ
jgi:hypothetical protein